MDHDPDASEDEGEEQQLAVVPDSDTREDAIEDMLDGTHHDPLKKIDLRPHDLHGQSSSLKFWIWPCSA